MNFSSGMIYSYVTLRNKTRRMGGAGERGVYKSDQGKFHFILVPQLLIRHLPAVTIDFLCVLLGKRRSSCAQGISSPFVAMQWFFKAHYMGKAQAPYPWDNSATPPLLLEPAVYCLQDHDYSRDLIWGPLCHIYNLVTGSFPLACYHQNLPTL